MEQNFQFIWIYSLQIVKYHLDNDQNDLAYDVYDKAAKLVSKYYSKAYADSVRILGQKHMNTIWRLDSEASEKDN